MKTVAFCINTISKSGPGNIVFNLIKNLDKKTYKPVLITLFQNDDKEIVKHLVDSGITVIQMKQKNKLLFLAAGKKNLQNILNKIRADIYHSHGFIPDLVGLRLKNVKKISTLHNLPTEDYRYEYGTIKGKILKSIHLKCLHKYDKVVCCAKWIYDELHHNNENMTYVRNGVDIPHGQEITREELGIPNDSTVFIYVGRMCRRKNTVNLIRDFHNSHDKNDYLIIVGDGEDHKQCADIKDKNIILLGKQDRPIEYISASDIYISESLSEGLSVSIIEALSCGLTALLSDIPSHQEMLAIDKHFKIGAIIGKDFEKSLSEIKDIRKRISKDKIITFQRTYLSAKAMTGQYSKEIYETI